MRIALIADTHGHLDPRIAERVAGVEMLVHAGDVGPAIVQTLRALSSRVVIVQGNNDPADSGWQESERLALPGGELAVNHGHRWPAKNRGRRLRAVFSEAEAVVFGHSHRRMLDTDARPWLINPGAAGRSRAYGGPSYVVLTAVPGRWRIETHVYEPASRKRRRP